MAQVDTLNIIYCLENFKTTKYTLYSSTTQTVPMWWKFQRPQRKWLNWKHRSCDFLKAAMSLDAGVHWKLHRIKQRETWVIPTTLKDELWCHMCQCQHHVTSGLYTRVHYISSWTRKFETYEKLLQNSPTFIRAGNSQLSVWTVSYKSNS